MKIKSLKLKLLLLIFAGVITACDGKEDFQKVKPESIANDVSNFFETNLPWPASLKSECFFVGSNNDTCIIINSFDEFISNFSCTSIALPTIDFESKTLIVGQHQMPYINCRIAEQEIVIESKKIKLNLLVEMPDSGFPAFGTVYYWGIYQKLPNKPININIRYKE